MPEYLRDLDLNEDKDVHLDDTNDLAISEGRANLEQGIALSVMEITHRVIGEKYTAANLSLLEQRVEEYLAEDPHVEEVLRVTTETVNRDSGIITMRIDVDEDESFTIELTE